MRIFIVHEDIYNAGNPYIYTLVEEIQKIDHTVQINYGRELFWDESIFDYDIVHFQWPQAFMAGDKHNSEDLLNHIQEMKRHNVKILATCHDLEPHYNQCVAYKDCIKIVYENSDVILHLGEYSLELFSNIYPYIQHLLLPHHIFNTVYPNIPTKKEAIEYLGLEPNKHYILCMGMFRDDAERKLVISAAKQLKNRNIVFIAPAFMEVNNRKSLSLIPTRSKLKYFMYKWRYNILMTGHIWVPIEDVNLPYYYAVSDIAFIQRLKILNSGNAVLPMLFGKVIVGPDIANVGILLKKWGYPTFNIYNIKEVGNVIKKGLELANKGFGDTIRTKQLEVYSTESISEQLYKYYTKIIK